MNNYWYPVVMNELTELTPNMQLVYGGNRIATVTPKLANAFKSGDRLIIVQTTGDLLHIPAEAWNIANEAVSDAYNAFKKMGSITNQQISNFYEIFAQHLEEENSFEPIIRANEKDVLRAQKSGRSTERLILSQKMRTEMINGLRMWKDSKAVRGQVIETIEHSGWKVEQIHSGLGPVGFVFEGRPNVFADATGVLRTGNTVVFRIGSDALGTAKAITQYALQPALKESGLPTGAVSLVASETHAAGWAMFSDNRLALAVARGSGDAVNQLGAVARQTGIPVSLHGTGGAWILATKTADPNDFINAIMYSLDRKVCNTLNTLILTKDSIAHLKAALFQALAQVQKIGDTHVKLHIVSDHKDLIPKEWFEKQNFTINGKVKVEPQTDIIDINAIGTEWEWDKHPELTITIAENLDDAINLFNQYSPHFIASLISNDSAEHAYCFDHIDSPFMGNGMTRWVDGQYALNRPELGLSNWEFGRLFSRGGILSGDSIFTIRTRAFQENTELHR